jgi:uncharacterized protein with HEPN domain
VRAFTAEGYESFSENEMAQFAVTWAFQTAGEVAKKLPDTFRKEHPEINWRQLISFRDFLAHNYDRIEIGPMWAAVDDLPNLIPALQALHDSLPDETQ